MTYNIHDTIGLKDYEIIVVNSGGTQTTNIANMPNIKILEPKVRLGPAQAKNLGSSKSYGELLMFADAHLQFEDGWGDKLVKSAQIEHGLVAPCVSSIGVQTVAFFGMTWNEECMRFEWSKHNLLESLHRREIAATGGACMLIEKDLFYKVGQFDSGMRFYGPEDIEFCIRLWLMGYKVICEPSVKVAHKFRKVFPYSVDSVDRLYNILRMALCHFSSDRLVRYIKILLHVFPNFVPCFRRALLMNLINGVLSRREQLMNKRVYTDSYYFEKFSKF